MTDIDPKKLEKGGNYWILLDGRKYPVIAHFDGTWFLILHYQSFLPTHRGLRIISSIEIPDVDSTDPSEDREL